MFRQCAAGFITTSRGLPEAAWRVRDGDYILRIALVQTATMLLTPVRTCVAQPGAAP